MRSTSWTRQQKQAIDARGGTVLVSAAAGSGKTAVLTTRVIEKITDKQHPIDADQLVIATFSNAAANEMKHRINVRLSQLIAQNPDDDFLVRQQMLLQKAQISTIHALCLNLLRDHFHVVGVAPDFKIGDEAELSQYRQQAVDAVLEAEYQIGHEAFLTLSDIVYQRDDKGLSNLILKVYEFVRAHPFPQQWMAQKLALYNADCKIEQTVWGELAFSYLREATQFAVELTEQALELIEQEDQMKEKYAPAFSMDLRQLQTALTAIGHQNWDEVCQCVVGFEFAKLGGLRGYEDLQRKETVLNLRDEVKDIVKKDLYRVAAFSQQDFADDTYFLRPVIEKLFDLVVQMDASYHALKQEHGLIDFTDLEHYAVKILSKEVDGGYEKSEIAKVLSERIDEILVDEYQDTNQVQDLIFHLLSKDGNNLFMVGDVKQSIYGFRQANPALFMQKREQFAAFDDKIYPARIILRNNFRSHPDVTESVNLFFYQIMRKALCGIDYNTEEALLASAEFAPLPDTQTELQIVDTDGSEEMALVLEARNVAQKIDTMLREGYLVQDGDHVRPCEYRDFCILLRSVKGKADVFMQQLKAFGINCWSDDSVGYLDAREIAVMLNLLRVIDNPLLDIPLLSVMMSPMFLFDSDDMVRIRLCAPKQPLYTAVQQFAQTDEKARRFLQTLDDLREKSVVMPIDKLISRIYDQTDFVAVFAAMPDGEQKRANLKLLLQYAKGYDSTSNAGLSGFIRYINHVADSKSDLVSANVISENANVVRVMSIHRSKGLEFPICIVADCAKKYNQQDIHANSLISAQLGAVLKIKKPREQKNYTSLMQEVVALQLAQQNNAEEMRILYVALTRAKQKLIISMAMSGLEKKLRSYCNHVQNGQISSYALQKANSYAQLLLSALLCQPGITPEDMLGSSFSFKDGHMCVQMKRLDDTVLQDDKQEPEEIAPIEADADTVELLRNRFDFVYPYTADTQTPAKLSVTQIVKKATQTATVLDIQPAFLRHESVEQTVFSGAQRGTLMHRFMEVASYEHACVSVKLELDRLQRMHFFTPQEAQALDLKRLEAFFASDFYNTITRAEQMHREFKFSYEMPANDIFDQTYGDSNVMVQGIADCVLVNPTGITIIDYKTDFVTDVQTLVDRYQYQVQIYAKAIAQAFELPIEACYLYSFSLGREIKIDL